jgi:hypothetical protein
MKIGYDSFLYYMGLYLDVVKNLCRIALFCQISAIYERIMCGFVCRAVYACIGSVLPLADFLHKENYTIGSVVMIVVASCQICAVTKN